MQRNINDSLHNANDLYPFYYICAISCPCSCSATAGSIKYLSRLSCAIKPGHSFISATVFLPSLSVAVFSAFCSTLEAKIAEGVIHSKNSRTALLLSHLFLCCWCACFFVVGALVSLLLLRLFLFC